MNEKEIFLLGFESGFKLGQLQKQSSIEINGTPSENSTRKEGKRKSYNRGPKWTEQEDNYIRANINSMHKRDIAEKLGRTTRAVETHYSLMKINSKSEKDPYSGLARLGQLERNS